ncbi:hypothetical protein APED_04760 [Acanthopleuribacter pedis]
MSLQGEIHRLAARFDAPRFTPHVTAYGGKAVVDEALEAVVRRLVAACVPLTLPVTGLTHGDFLFQTLFLSLGATPALADWFTEITDALGNPKNYRLNPHLSLIYAPLTDADKQALSFEKQGWYEAEVPASLVFDRLALVTPGPRGWHPFDHWRQVLEVPLG